jgi:hypothetical protein
MDGNDDGGLTPRELNRQTVFIVIGVISLFCLPLLLRGVG